MANVKSSVQLPATPEEVWRTVADFGTYQDWMSIHQGWKSELPAQIEVGTKITQMVSIMGMANKIEWTVEEFTPPRTLTISGCGMAGVEVSFTLSVEPSGDGAQATMDGEFTGQMIVGALGAAVEKNSKKELDASMAKLGELLG